jgi:hypothetical protein
MNLQRGLSGPEAVTVAGLVVGALGIALLWASGVEFPVYPPPGILILLAGALFVGLAHWRWVPGVGAFLGLFVLVGFFLSPLGIPHMFGAYGTARQIGQAIQVIGVVTALIAGVIATQANYRPQSSTSQQDPRVWKG